MITLNSMADSVHLSRTVRCFQAELRKRTSTMTSSPSSSTSTECTCRVSSGTPTRCTEASRLMALHRVRSGPVSKAYGDLANPVQRGAAPGSRSTR